MTRGERGGGVPLVNIGDTIKIDYRGRVERSVDHSVTRPGPCLLIPLYLLTLGPLGISSQTPPCNLQPIQIIQQVTAVSINPACSTCRLPSSTSSPEFPTAADFGLVSTPAFAPQWGKSIKPSGSTPTTDHSPSHVPPPAARSAQTPTTTTPFPSLNQSQNRSSSPSTIAPSTSDPRLSYSRAANTPQSPSFPEHSYFPPPGEAEHPFRYSKAQILGQWDESKVQERPIEFMQMADEGSVLVSKSVIRPAGLRELTEMEKKLLATSVNPPSVARRQPGASSGTSGDVQMGNGVPSRRPIGPPKDVNGGPGRSIGFGGFGRGEGIAPGAATGKIGAFAGPPGAALGDPKSPSTAGLGFAGVGRGIRRKVEGEAASDPTRSAQSNWRSGPQRNQSGTFEGGVLGFGGSTSEQNRLAISDQMEDAPVLDDPAIVAGAPGSAWRDRMAERQKEKMEVSPQQENGEQPVFGSGGGPGWGSGPKRWRLAAEQKEGAAFPSPTTLDIPHTATELSDSVAATASQTPIPERDAAVRDIDPSTSALPHHEPYGATIPPPSAQQMDDDARTVQWLYRDPLGVEQGPFAGQLMHEWFAGNFFEDDLPLRRVTDSGFITLAELKQITGSPAQPFLTPIRPRGPPGIPPQHGGPFPPGPEHALRDSFGHMRLNGHPDMAQFGAPSPFEPQSRFGPALEQPGLFSPNHNPAFGSPHPASFGRPNEPWSPAQTMPGPQRGFGLIGAEQHSTFHDPHSHAFSPAIGAPHRDTSTPGVFSMYPGAPAADPSWGAAGQPQRAEPNETQWPAPLEPEHHFSPQQRDDLQAQPLEAIEQPLTDSFAKGELEAPPQVEELQDAIAEGTKAADSELADAPEPISDQIASLEAEEEALSVKEPKAAPASVWGAPGAAVKTTSGQPRRKSSLLPSLPASAQLPAAPSTSTTQSASKLPPAPASLPAKPVVSPRKSSISEAPKQSPPPASSTGLPVKPAPWATGNGDAEAVKHATGLSLRDIQAAEAKQAEAKKASRAEARPQVDTGATGEEVLQNMTFGLPQQGQRTTSFTNTSAVGSPVTPAWGGGDAGPKKTLKQIQEEEERRNVKAAQARAAQQGQTTPNGPIAVQTKRGYADLAATAAAPAVPVGWSVVGATKASSTASPVTPGAASRPAAVSRSSTIARTSTPSPAPGNKSSTQDVGPSPDFLRWTRSALTDLTIPVDEFVSMLLTFPIDPPAADKPGVLEVISDSVYAHSSTLDGRRFANEFYTRRKADAQRVRSGGATTAALNKSVQGSGGGSLADIVKKEPKKENPLAGFTVVSKQKGKKKT